MIKKTIGILLAALMLTSTLAACAPKAQPQATDGEGQGAGLSIVCTNFAEYDFVRQITGDMADITLLLKPGSESHSYEPTPADVIKIQESDLFVYVGGESDKWIEGVLDAMDQSKMHLFKLMDCVDTLEEELAEGMQPEAEEEEAEEEEGPELDEHVWTSPKNAMAIVRNLRDTLTGLSPEGKEAFESNAASYLAKLQQLDDDFIAVIDTAKRKEIIVGDRFPFLYFCKEYGLTYYAAFPGCAADTEPSAATVTFLIDKVKADGIPVVFHIELSNERMADSICEATGAKKELLNAVHNITDADFKAGVTYLDLMAHNVEVLKEALN